MFFNEKCILPERKIFRQKTAKAVKMVRLTLLRNSKCVLFEKESNGFSEEFYNRFYAVGHTSIQILTIQLTMYVSLGKLLCL